MEDKITCKEVINHICDNLGEDLNSPRCIAIKSHLEGCNCCKSYSKSVETTISFYKNYNAELPKEAHDRLLSSLGLNE
ncbi:MAG: hypothetical protein WCJ01_09585 [Ignavibacteria bacterium]